MIGVDLDLSEEQIETIEEIKRASEESDTLPDLTFSESAQLLVDLALETTVEEIEEETGVDPIEEPRDPEVLRALGERISEEEDS